MYQQLKAFTILELLVAMAVTGMVVSIAGVSYNMLAKQLNLYQEMNETFASVSRLHSVLSEDVINAQVITGQEEELLIWRDQDVHTRYTFYDSFLVRTSVESRDTFYIGVQDLVFGYVDETGESNVIDEVSLNASIMGERESFYYRKRYDAAIKMEWKEIKHGN